jgi:hypothetical protein
MVCLETSKHLEMRAHRSVAVQAWVRKALPHNHRLRGSQRRRCSCRGKHPGQTQLPIGLSIQVRLAVMSIVVGDVAEAACREMKGAGVQNGMAGVEARGEMLQIMP